MSAQGTMPHMERKKLLIACGIVVVLAGILITVATVAANQASNSNAQNTDKTAAPIKVTGHLACLKHKGASQNEPQTLECAIGLQADNGRYYALKSLPDSSKDIEFSSAVQVTGNLAQPTNDDKYDTDGTITVTDITTDVIVR